MASSRGTRQLAAVMFTDIVGYSALVQRDEGQAYRLLEAHRRIVRATLRSFAGREVETNGDAFLLEFSSALSALRCAVALQQTFAATPQNPGEERISLRIGMHLGDIERPGKRIFGDTVNIASRLQPLSPKGGVALSAQVYHQVVGKLALNFQAIGATSLKNIAQPIEVYVLDANAILAAEMPLAGGHSLLGNDRPARKWPGKPALWILAGLTIVILLVLAAWRLRPSGPVIADADTPSVAVLPLKNLSKDPDDAYLAGGIHDAVLTSLSQIRDLKSIARNSVAEYAPESSNVIQIGKELGVRNVVEGSVERHGNFIRVSLRLIDAINAKPRWSQTFERRLDVSYSMGSEISETIARQLNARVTAQEAARIEEVPTANPEAFAACMRADQLTDQHAAHSAATALWRRQQYEHAIALDPKFLWPYAALASDRINNYLFGVDTTTEGLDAARDLLRRMEKIDPASVLTRTLRAYFLSQILHDDVRAAEEASAALQLRPGDATLYQLLAITQVHQEQMDAAISNFSLAQQLDPKDLSTAYDLSDAYSLKHDYRASIPLTQALVRAVPREPAFADALAYQQFGMSGNAAQFLQTIGSLSANVDLVEFLRLSEKFSLAAIGGRFDEADEYLRKQPDSIVLEQSYAPLPRELAEAYLLWLRGDIAGAQQGFRKALPKLQKKFEAGADDIDMHAWRGFAAAVLGDRRTAHLEAQMVEESAGYRRPEHRQAFSTLVAMIYLQLGENDEAINQIELMLQRPSYASKAYVANDVTWQALRSNPRFRKLVVDSDARNVTLAKPGVAAGGI